MMTDASYADVPGFFEACDALDYFAGRKTYYEKMEGEYRAKIDKAIQNFKKETLLYEVNTFEEILTYSVSRLRDSALSGVPRAVELLDGVAAALEMMLKKNYIIPIRPVPHDIFNAREHEVLMAEKQDGFNKGEIIKLLNSGYKHKDTVILRANVIAAG
jgi:molecular chaperone GrpE (heat shock protein)